MQALFKRVLIVVTLFAFLFTNVYSQDSRIVTGKITNSNGSGISGAVVRVLPSRKVVTADNTGDFKISLTASDKSLDCLLYTSPSPRD